jgi:hypothetical protein
MILESVQINCNCKKECNLTYRWVGVRNSSSTKDEESSNSNQRSTSVQGPKKHGSSAKLKATLKLKLLLISFVKVDGSVCAIEAAPKMKSLQTLTKEAPALELRLLLISFVKVDGSVCTIEAAPKLKSLQTLTKEAPALCEGGWVNVHN